jgi:hypothetical protein
MGIRDSFSHVITVHWRPWFLTSSFVYSSVFSNNKLTVYLDKNKKINVWKTGFAFNIKHVSRPRVRIPVTLKTPGTTLNSNLDWQNANWNTFSRTQNKFPRNVNKTLLSWEQPDKGELGCGQLLLGPHLYMDRAGKVSKDTAGVYVSLCKGEGKVHPRTGHEGPEGE